MKDSPPTTTNEVAELRSEVSELRGLLRRLLSADEAAAKSHETAADRSHRASAEFDAQLKRVAAAAEARRLEGPKKFRVQLDDGRTKDGRTQPRSCPELVCGGVSEADAITKYRVYLGMLRTDHDFSVSEVPAAAAA